MIDWVTIAIPVLSLSFAALCLYFTPEGKRMQSLETFGRMQAEQLNRDHDRRYSYEGSNLYNPSNTASPYYYNNPSLLF